MLPHYRCLCPLLCLVLISGCGLKTSQQTKYIANANGVNVEVYGSGEHNTHWLADDDVQVTNGANRLNIKSGRVLANGKDYGAVKKGDTVVLAADGQVSVNNSPRPPSD